MVQKRNDIIYEILLELIRRENHLRGIAKSLNQSHTTILRKLNFLVEENVLDYRMQGKNKIFFVKNSLQAKNYVFNAENYKMIKLIKKYPKLSVIIENILKETDKELVILFGSYAKFSAQKDSDIDIYVETTDKKVKEDLEDIHSKIKVKIGEFDKKSMLIKEIIKNHIILKGVERFYEKIEFFE